MNQGLNPPYDFLTLSSYNENDFQGQSPPLENHVSKEILPIIPIAHLADEQRAANYMAFFPRRPNHKQKNKFRHPRKTKRISLRLDKRTRQ